MSITAKYLNQLKPQLSDRDLAIMAEVGRFKLMTGGQIERLFFAHLPEKSRSRNRQAVMRRLVTHHVMERVGERRMGGSARGSASYLYTLGIAGQHLAENHSKRPRREYSWYEPTIGHFLAIAELYVTLMEAHWAGRLALLSFETEPHSWRNFAGRTLKPDAFVRLGIRSADGRAYRGQAFIEVDRGTQRGTKIATKLPQYLAYRRHEEAHQPGRLFPRVVFLAPHDDRVAYLERLVDEHPQHRAIFTVGLLDDPVTALLKP
ncbi:replication-relaxation family protein [Streptomyces sp. NPDC090075]|uniref:replication-relaxation family protein n=1 Tax=Streptomyces sp. NPDC090075 TaxID=3365937 RepID=UPI00382F8824